MGGGILLIDNYDSFTYNLYQCLSELDRVTVYRNDKVSLRKIESINPDRIVISPGPGNPLTAGISNNVIRRFYKKKPILGVCLGHQCIGHIFGSRIINAKQIVHGKTSKIQVIQDSKLFRGLPRKLIVARYHSLVVESIPEKFILTSATGDGEIMSMEHPQYPLYGIQFHPESFLTKCGKRIIKNFVEL